MFYASLYVREEDIPGLEVDNYDILETFQSWVPGVARLRARRRQQELKAKGVTTWVF